MIDSHRAQSGLFKNRPQAFIALVLLTICVSYAYKLRAQGIFACQAAGYSTNSYLVDCNAAAYGDYDHGAFWYGIEPDALLHASQADVLFVGSSQLQFAFSTPATVRWFDALAASFYLMGFTHTENVNFIAPLLERIKPNAKVYVINVDRFFHDRLTPPTTQLRHEDDAEARYASKKRWQNVHQRICGSVPTICGNGLVMFRSRANGYWTLDGAGGLTPAGVSDGPSSLEERWPEFAAIGEKFIDSLPVDRSCVVLTLAPWSATRRQEADFIAEKLEMELISPVLDGLVTYDGSHLDAPSRERWAEAFFDAAGPRIRECLRPAAL